MLLLPSPLSLLRRPLSRHRLVKQGVRASPRRWNHTGSGPFLLLLLLASIAFCPRTAVAGRYTTAYSGGTCSPANPYATYKNFTPTDPSMDAGAQRDGYEGSAGGTTGASTCSGEITATFTWEPSHLGEAPPKCVVIEEYATAGWNGGSYEASPTGGTASNGLGATATNSYSQETGGRINYWHGTGSCSSVRYTIKQNPGISFPITCSPAASAPAALSPPVSYNQTSASVVYRARTLPVLIVLGGVTDADKAIPKVLTGQRVVATVTTGLGTIVPTNWVASPMDAIFESWSPSDGTFVATPPSGGLQYSFFTLKDANITLTCAATLTLPDSTTRSLSVESYPIHSVKPVAVWDIKGGGVHFNSVVPDGPTSGASIFGAFGYNASNVFIPGQSWQPTFTFSDGFSGGSGAILQITTRKREGIYANRTSVPYRGTASGTGLDGGFPYKGLIFPAGPTPPTTLRDSPSMGLGGGFSSLEASNLNDTWLMYLPPQVGNSAVSYVPMRTYHWEWAGKVHPTGTSSNNSLIWAFQSKSGAGDGSSTQIDAFPPPWASTLSGNYSLVPDPDWINPNP